MLSFLQNTLRSAAVFSAVEGVARFGFCKAFGANTLDANIEKTAGFIAGIANVAYSIRAERNSLTGNGTALAELFAGLPIGIISTVCFQVALLQSFEPGLAFAMGGFLSSLVCFSLAEIARECNEEDTQENTHSPVFRV